VELHACLLLQNMVVSLCDFVATFPYLAETNCGMVAIENGQWRADVSDDGPRPLTEEFRLDRMGVESALLQRYNGPLFNMKNCLINTSIEGDLSRFSIPLQS